MICKNETVSCLMENAKEIAEKTARGNVAAMLAIETLLKDYDGAQAFKEMSIMLTSEEWGKLYSICEEDPSRIVPSVIVINCMRDDLIVRRNLRLKYPAQFAIEPIEDYFQLAGNAKWLVDKRLREAFIKRYNDAKNCQS